MRLLYKKLIQNKTKIFFNFALINFKCFFLNFLYLFFKSIILKFIEYKIDYLTNILPMLNTYCFKFEDYLNNLLLNVQQNSLEIFNLLH